MITTFFEKHPLDILREDCERNGGTFNYRLAADGKSLAPRKGKASKQKSQKRVKPAKRQAA